MSELTERVKKATQIPPEEAFDDIDATPEYGTPANPEILDQADKLMPKGAKLPQPDDSVTTEEEAGTPVEETAEAEDIAEDEPEEEQVTNEGSEEQESEEEHEDMVPWSQYEELEKKRRGFQSAYDRMKKQLEQTQELLKNVLAVGEGGNGNGNGNGTGQPMPGADTSAQSTKSPQDFMPEGLDYDPIEAIEPGTPSYQARIAHEKYLVESTMNRRDQLIMQKLQETTRKQAINMQYEILRQANPELQDEENFTKFKKFVEGGSEQPLTLQDFWEFYQFKTKGIGNIINKEKSKVFEKIKGNSNKLPSMAGKNSVAEPGVDEDLKELNEIFGD